MNKKLQLSHHILDYMGLANLNTLSTIKRIFEEKSEIKHAIEWIWKKLILLQNSQLNEILNKTFSLIREPVTVKTHRKTLLKFEKIFQVNSVQRRLKSIEYLCCFE